MELEITNVVTISVSAAPVGIGEYNTSNIALFTRETPNESFGDDDYKIYKSPSEVTTDFGSDSETSKMAISIFSQKPNILAGGGYLVVIPLLEETAAVVETQSIEYSATPTTGSYKLNYGGDETAAIAFGANAAAVETAIRTLTGLESVTVSGSVAAGFTVTFTGVSGDADLLTVSENSLDDTDGNNVEIDITETLKGVASSSDEDLDEAITRTQDLVQYFGILATEISSQADMLAAAAVVQTLNKIAFFPSKTAADVEEGGMLDLLRSGSYDKCRGLLYIHGGDTSDTLNMAAAYAGRALSTDFSGSNTTQTMHLKDLVGIQSDSEMTQPILEKCKTAGVDTYVSIRGVSKVFSTGGNTFFDRVYNREWFVGALQTAGFNALAQSSSKVAQTEAGVAVLKAAYRRVCDQAVINQYSAPGEWNSPDTFGNQDDFLRNIRSQGYYVYSAPVALQSQVEREGREAPLIQIALKEAGAMHSTSVIVYINP